MGNRKFGWKSGQIHALNIQTGTAVVAAGATGYGETAVVFKNTFKNVPVINCTTQEMDTTGVLSITTSDVTGFTVHLESSALVNDNVSVGWSAIDQTK